MQPDLTPYDPVIDEGDRARARSRRASRRQNPQARRRSAQLQGTAIRNSRSATWRTRRRPTFRFNVNPFVIWIWLGGAIVGDRRALFAIWPAPEARAAGSPTSTRRASRASSTGTAPVGAGALEIR